MTVRRTFWIGFIGALAGATLIWAADGSETTFRKAVVLSGLLLAIAGIALLRYLLFARLGRNRPTK